MIPIEPINAHQKIMDYLALSYRELSVQHISEKLDYTPRSVFNFLKEMESLGLVEFNGNKWAKIKDRNTWWEKFAAYCRKR